MTNTGSVSSTEGRAEPGAPLWLLAELTYRCPLQCAYCANPLELDAGNELSTAEWVDVLGQARELGAAQLGFSGGEPLVRQDLGVLIREARALGYYSNLITSGMGLTEARVAEFRVAGLDHIQISFQASEAERNDRLAGSRKAFAQKRQMARAVKAAGYPMVLNFVIHRGNIEDIGAMIELAVELEADYVELATAQYYGWARVNRDHLLPRRDQLETAERITRDHRQRLDGAGPKLIFVVPDYYEERPKNCGGGWGRLFMGITPDGTALPCHSARELPLEFPNVRHQKLAAIWRDSSGFNRFRGDDWMQEPCRSCDEKAQDFGGCRCQAFALTGDMTAADPVCAKSPDHGLILAAREQAETGRTSGPLLARRADNSQKARDLIARG